MPTPLRVLIVEDVQDDADLLLRELRRSNFEPLGKRVETADAMASALDKGGWDIIVCDYSLPQFDALGALSVVKNKGLDIPFVILSGSIGEEVAVALVKAGVDDYILKGNMTRLGSAVQRQLEEAVVRRERRRAEEELHETNLRLIRALAELEQNQRRLIQQERLDALQQLASGVVHELRNLVTPIIAYSEVLIETPDRMQDMHALKSDLMIVHKAAEDVLAVALRLEQFYRPAEMELRTTLDINRIIEQAILLTKPKWSMKSRDRGLTVTMRSELLDVPPIHGSETELREVFTNLILNAADALVSDGSITCKSFVEDSNVVLTVHDTGVGMSEETVARCTEPFFTTKGAHGTGMGLAIAFGIVQRHGGALEVASTVGTGTSVTIRLPVAPASR